MSTNKSLWKKIWEPEDSRTFGELFLIIASLLLTKSLEQFLPNLSKIIYLGIGFILLLFAVKLLRKSEK